MTPDEVDAFARSLAGCRRKGTAEHPAWYVDDRLVARLVDPTELVVRTGLDERERMVAEHPETFGVPPHHERRGTVQVLLSGDAAAIRAAIHGAWRMQRR
ncbi:MAG TPA: hypothetical protein VNS46_17590 [Nocardioides sp.]|nr:hypothetical protein [Nocardioides sp.]